jgi:G:T-mismatch repair DNA endonuclease (very short patch repair protein)
LRLLRKEGWEVLELWECEIRRNTGLLDKLVAFMND